MFVNCFHVFSLSALPCRKPENAQVPPSFPVVGLVFYLPYPKPPVLPDVRNQAINGSADFALRRKNYEQDKKRLPSHPSKPVDMSALEQTLRKFRYTSHS